MAMDFLGALAAGLSGYREGRMQKRDWFQARKQQEFQNQLAQQAQDLQAKQMAQQQAQFQMQMDVAKKQFEEEMALRSRGQDQDILESNRRYMLDFSESMDRSNLAWKQVWDMMRTGNRADAMAQAQILSMGASTQGEMLQNLIRSSEARLAVMSEPWKAQGIRQQTMMGDLMLRSMPAKLDAELVGMLNANRISEEEAIRAHALTPLVIEAAQYMPEQAKADVAARLADVALTMAQTEGVDVKTEYEQALLDAGMPTLEARKLATGIAGQTMETAVNGLRFQAAQMELDRAKAGAQEGAGRFQGLPREDLVKARAQAWDAMQDAQDKAAGLMEPAKELAGVTQPWGFTVEEMLDAAQNGRAISDPLTKKTVRVKDDRITSAATAYLEARETLAQIEDALYGKEEEKPAAEFPGEITTRVYPDQKAAPVSPPTAGGSAGPKIVRPRRPAGTLPRGMSPATRRYD